MAEFVVVGFENEDDADRVLTELTRLQSEYLIGLEDAVVFVPGARIQTANCPVSSPSVELEREQQQFVCGSRIITR